jgi:cell division protein YceG involved in septum cleavage
MRERPAGRTLLTLLLLVIGLAAALGGGYVWVQTAYNSPGPSKDSVRIQVEQGASVRTVLMDLAKQGVLQNPRAVEIYLRL